MGEGAAARVGHEVNPDPGGRQPAWGKGHGWGSGCGQSGCPTVGGLPGVHAWHLGAAPSPVISENLAHPGPGKPLRSDPRDPGTGAGGGRHEHQGTASPQHSQSQGRRPGVGRSVVGGAGKVEGGGIVFVAYFIAFFIFLKNSHFLFFFYK